jgi:DNA-binding protein H-NS
MAAKKVAVPDAVRQLGQQLDEFRSTRSGRGKLPEWLWQAAVEQAREHGVNVVAQALRLDYNVLKRRVGSVEQRQKRAAMPAFVELIGAAATTGDEYIVEFEGAPRPRMRVQWKSAMAPDWAALLRAWREVMG